MRVFKNIWRERQNIPVFREIYSSLDPFPSRTGRTPVALSSRKKAAVMPDLRLDLCTTQPRLKVHLTTAV